MAQSVTSKFKVRQRSQKSIDKIQRLNNRLDRINIRQHKLDKYIERLKAQKVKLEAKIKKDEEAIIKIENTIPTKKRSKVGDKFVCFCSDINNNLT